MNGRKFQYNPDPPSAPVNVAMHILHGSPALSDSRNQKVLARIRVIQPSIRDIDAHFVYFVDSTQPIGNEDLARLCAILQAREADSNVHKQPSLLVCPRLGTISPWSSKATEIISRCGLDKIARVERGVAWFIRASEPLVAAVQHQLYDRMTESCLESLEQATALFSQDAPRPMRKLEVLAGGIKAMQAVNERLGLALADDEMEYLLAAYTELGREPTEVELMMFAQANSEHCRHKIFNATWSLDGQPLPHSLFGMIRNTHAQASDGVLSAYSDNAAVVAGSATERFFSDTHGGEYHFHAEPVHLLMKVETHNHPTAISPYAGAGTGSGGEIRDEGAVGRGSKPKAGLCGFSVSNLRIPDFIQPWEVADIGKPDRIVSARQIMLEGPIGAAAFNNEFGRPNLAGYFRTFEMEQGGEVRGYHKPIMIAGGYGNIREMHVDKAAFSPGHCLIVLGGPAMLIGLGGGAASSMNSGASSEDLDFASVQRQNPEMQRRCQEVIDRCWALGEDNPIAFIHDVGAGGLSNALPELVKDGGTGGTFDLRKLPVAESGMSPLEIWCNEAQERYVLAVLPENLNLFCAICERERTPYAVVGRATESRHLRVEDPLLKDQPVDLPMSVLFGKPPRMHRDIRSSQPKIEALTLPEVATSEALGRVLRHPAVASKAFLITIGDRSITGMVVRDQMVGPWQVPVADAAVTTAGYRGFAGEAMAMGERTPLALIDGPASARMAVAEAITNIAGVQIGALSKVRLSANWMCAAGYGGEDEILYRMVEAVGMELCPQLGIAIPVGKDSMSMQTRWQTHEGEQRRVTAPTSLIVSAFAPVEDVRSCLTPQLVVDGDNSLWLIDLSDRQERLGGSILAQCYGQLGSEGPDLNHPKKLAGFFGAMQQCLQEGLLLAYHDRSDGGLLVTALEMAFAGGCGVELRLPSGSGLATLFNEEPGALIQISNQNSGRVKGVFAQHGVEDCLVNLGRAVSGDLFSVRAGEQLLLQESRIALHRQWAETSFRMQAERDDSDCAREEFERIGADDPGLNAQLTFDAAADISAPYIQSGARPRIAVLREQGVNGQLEMAAAFDAAGFQPVDVHMSDLLAGRHHLEAFRGLVACGGFSYGDVLGAGRGWATSILFNQQLRDQFQAFFAREDAFALGVCNGCQMFAGLRELMPGTELWPDFVQNRSEQFEARVALVRVEPTASILFSGMEGSVIPVAVAHGEGRVRFASDEQAQQAIGAAQVALRYVDNHHRVTDRYPFNPNGSLQGITSLTNRGGRITAMMPHPERVFRTITNSWHPQDWPDDGPWLRMFRNARAWVG